MNIEEKILIMRNVRRLLGKTNRNFVNWVLYTKIFENGGTTSSVESCKKIGIDPWANTIYHGCPDNPELTEAK